MSLRSLFESLMKLFRRKKKRPPASPYPDAIPVSEIRFLGENVGAWPVKYSLKVHTDSQFIWYDQGGTAVWPAKGGLVGNAWVVAKVNGSWVAASHEYFRPRQRNKGIHTVAGDHIKRPEFGASWRPTPGETYGFFATGLARAGLSNVKERTQIVTFVWRHA